LESGSKRVRIVSKEEYHVQQDFFLCKKSEISTQLLKNLGKKWLSPPDLGWWTVESWGFSAASFHGGRNALWLFLAVFFVLLGVFSQTWVGYPGDFQRATFAVFRGFFRASGGFQ